MATFKITDPSTGQVLRITGDSPPTEAELEQIFSSQAEPRAATPQIAPGPTVEQPPAPVTAATRPSLASTLGETLSGRGEDIAARFPAVAEMSKRRARGEVSELEVTLEALGQTVLAGGDILAAAVDIGAAGLEAIAPQSVEDTLEQFEVSVRESASEFFGTDEGKAVISALGEGVTSVAEVAAENPRSANVLKNLAVVGTAFLGLPGAGKAARGAVGTATKAVPTPITARGAFGQATREAAEARLDPTQLARQQRFEAQGIPATRGDITQAFTAQAEEARLISSATQEAGEPLRQLRLQQSEAFVGKVNELVDSLGVPSRTGDSLKEALSGRKKLLRKEKNALYKKVADTSPDIANAPIITDDIIAALPNPDTLEDIAIVGANVTGLKNALVRFGVDRSPAAIATFTEAGGTITPLTLGNFDRFRKLLGGLDRADQTGSMKVATGPIRRVLDEEAAFIDGAIKSANITDESIVSTLKEARGRVRELKTEFSPQAITGRLVDVKRDGVTPIIESSKVVNELLRASSPIENLERVVSSLSKSAKGKKAIKDLQSNVVLDTLNAALRAPSRKTSGIETFGGNQFAKALDKFGDDKLELLFKTDKQALKTLRDLKQTGLDISPTAAAIPRGSAPVILDIMRRVGRAPGVASVIDVATFVAKAGADDRAVRRAFKANPEKAMLAKVVSRDFPNLAERLGIIVIVDDEDE